MRTRFGMDLDGVIYNWASVALFLLNHRFGLDLDASKWTSYNWLERNVPEECLEWLWTEGVRRGMFRHGHVYRGSIESLREISDIADVIVISHRPTSLHGEVDEEIRRIAVDDTTAWLAFHRIPHTEVHLLTRREPKSTIRCDVYLDDSPVVTEDLCRNAPSSTTLLWDRPWNRAVASNTAVLGPSGDVTVFAPSSDFLEPWAKPQRLPIRVSSWGHVVGLLRQQS